MKPTIWSSDFIREPRLHRKTSIKLNIDEPTSRDFVDYQEKYEAGVPVGPEDVSVYPIAMYFQYYDIPESDKKSGGIFLELSLA